MPIGNHVICNGADLKRGDHTSMGGSKIRQEHVVLRCILRCWRKHCFPQKELPILAIASFWMERIRK